MELQIKLNKEELSFLLDKLTDDKDNSIYKKLEEDYLFITHQENAVKSIKRHYKDKFINCEYIHVDKNYENNILKYNVYYEMINQETYQREIIKDVELIKFVKNEDIYKYILVFHKRED